MKLIKRGVIAALCLVLALTAGCGNNATTKDPVSLTVWHYYNGS